MPRLKPCGCAPACLVRVERSWWMHLWWGKRLYFCTSCRSKLLISRPPKLYMAAP